MNNQHNIALIINDDCRFPSDYKEHLVSDLEEIPEGSCDNIYIGDLLDYLEKDNISLMLTEIISKLKVQDGLVHIKAPDLLQTCWYASRMNIDINNLRYILYETHRKNCHTIDEIISMIQSTENTSVVSASYINGYEYSITINKYEN